MKVLFLSVADLKSINQHGIYPDVLREFMKNNHEIYIVCPNERRTGKKTELINEKKSYLLRVRTGNITKSNLIEKGISTLIINSQYKRAVKKFFPTIKFDLIIYSTPPITLESVIKYEKKKNAAKTYLLLKDIFPQNAVDLGIINKNGLKGIIYKYFRRKEKELYKISDYIGCMSQANVDYLIKNNSFLDRKKIGICPNSIEVINRENLSIDKNFLREKYGIPLDKLVFVYGGNLGKPQGIDFIMKCLEQQKKNEKVFFLIVGDGTEYNRLNSFLELKKIDNAKLIKKLPKEDYELMIQACDVGMIFLDYRFTIPNFPSRILSYMDAEIPVFACTDKNSDIGSVIVSGKFGWWCESNNIDSFNIQMQRILNGDIKEKGKNGKMFLLENYTAAKAYNQIMNTINNQRNSSERVKK